MKTRFLFLLTAIIAIDSCNKSAPPPIPEKDTTNHTAQLLTVHTYITVSRDSSIPPSDTTSTFGISDTIHGIIKTDNAHDGTMLLGRWYYLKNGMKIAENSARLSAGTNLSHFDLINEQPWLQGQYKLIVLIDNAPKDSAMFTIANKR